MISDSRSGERQKSFEKSFKNRLICGFLTANCRYQVSAVCRPGESSLASPRIKQNSEKIRKLSKEYEAQFTGCNLRIANCEFQISEAPTTVAKNIIGLEHHGHLTVLR